MDMPPTLRDTVNALAFARSHMVDHEAGQATDAERAACVLALCMAAFASDWLELQRAPRVPQLEERRRAVSNRLDVLAQIIVNEVL